ncbi:uncharacterized protein ACHE_30531A [Aspergillus chevalieri]|uniref:Uncharacterized protein n=1 Tax=Aspergillus chevalieri TaxID=182096 RepID=A0A7R7VMA1_ASPCH|nr:uncharacterized protein ACHE_30531A [Aspergillus chevalieri]BCR86544.1 hypothetical protein ACHE_30531A [Aspergillus chevalieri]
MGNCVNSILATKIVFVLGDIVMPNFGLSKHYRHSNLPILIIRSTIIGLAIRHPFPHYGPHGSNPASTFVRIFLSSGSEPMVFHVLQGQTSGTDNLDEAPVD